MICLPLQLAKTVEFQAGSRAFLSVDFTYAGFATFTINAISVNKNSFFIRSNFTENLELVLLRGRISWLRTIAPACPSPQ